jgi:hypothetical protein
MHIAVMVFLSSDLARVGIHIHTRNDLLAMQSFPLFEEDEHDTGRYDGCQHDKPGNETEQAVGGDKADNGSARRHRRLIYIPALDAQKLKRPLQSLEQRVVRIAFVLAFHTYP